MTRNTGSAPRRYDVGGAWGNRVEWFRAPTEVAGWKQRIPEDGDLLFSPMQSGKVGVYRFTEVRRCGDPADMFFAKVEPLGYEDELDLEYEQPRSLFA